MYDIVVIGGGTGGYATALYAHNFGLKTALIEKDTVGGTCLVRGCIPAKSWLQAADVFQTVKKSAEYGVVGAEEISFDWPTALARKNKIVDGLVKGLGGLLKIKGVDVLNGFGRIEGPGRVSVEAAAGRQELETKNIVIATGSVPRVLAGFDFDGVNIVSSDHALDWESQPGRVGIIGAGAIGCEFASMLADLGSEVHVFELMEQIVPGADADAAKELQKLLKRHGVKFNTGTTVERPVVTDNGVTLSWGDGKSVEVDTVLVAVGRAPVTDGVGLENVGLQADRGFLVVDSAQRTGAPGVYAVGDIVANTPQLAHASFAEAITAVTQIATGTSKPVEYKAIPLVVYTHPEMAEVGLSEARAVAEGLEVEVHSHSFLGVGRAQIIGQQQGKVKVVVEKGGPIVGASIVGPQAGELIHELMYIVGWEALPEEAAAFIHAHPSLSEAVGETLLAATGKGLH